MLGSSRARVPGKRVKALQAPTVMSGGGESCYLGIDLSPKAVHSAPREVAAVGRQGGSWAGSLRPSRSWCLSLGDGIWRPPKLADLAAAQAT